MFGWIVLGVIIVFALLALYGAVSEKKDKGKASNKLDALKQNHNITISFVSMAGYLAFCDDEKMIYSFRNVTSDFREIPYDSIIYCERNPHIWGVSFWAINPTYTEYISGDVGNDKYSVLKNKIDSIIMQNATLARSEYNSIVSVPTNAARIKIKDCFGNGSFIPTHIVKRLSEIYAWSDNSNLYMFPIFSDLKRFKTSPELYRIISVSKSNIVNLSQEGDIHYTTEVSGGGGGGSSIKGAIIGGVIAGDAGAIIGSRKSTDPITSSTKQIDDRTTNLKILDANNNFFEIVFDYNDFYPLSKLVKK